MSATKKYTKEGFQKLKDEYEELTKVKMVEIVDKIAIARDFGDLSENAEYSAAREEQTKYYTRIQELEELIRNAVIVEETTVSGVIGLGSSVKITRNGIEGEYKIVGSNEADPFQNKISDSSAIGAAIMGKKAGDVVYATTNKGKTIEIKILDVFKA